MRVRTRRSWRLPAGVLGMRLLAGLVNPAAHGAVPAGRAVDNSRLDTGNDPLRGRDIPGMAVDPADPRPVVTIKGAADSRPFIIRPGVAVQPRAQGDKLYVVGWYVVNPPGMGASGGAGDRRAVVATSDDGGKTWSNPVEAQGPDEKVREIAPPVVAPDGAVYIAWRNRDDPAN